MAEFYVGQVMMTGFGWAQRQFAQCNGQTMAIQQNQALFALLGTYYGGDGIRTFLLPDLRSRTPAGALRNYPIGMIAGVETVTLTSSEMPTHNHLFDATTQNGATTDPAGALYGAAQNDKGAFPIYSETTAGGFVPLNNAQLSLVGGSQPHQNIQPYNTINFNIALSGIWPSRN